MLRKSAIVACWGLVCTWLAYRRVSMSRMAADGGFSDCEVLNASALPARTSRTAPSGVPPILKTIESG